MKKHNDLLIFTAVVAAVFYLLPLLSRNTGLAMLNLLCVTPLSVLSASLLYGVRKGFSLLLPLIVFLLFLPALFLFYNGSAFLYAPIFAALSLVGNTVGRAFYGKR